MLLWGVIGGLLLEDCFGLIRFGWFDFSFRWFYLVYELCGFRLVFVYVS